MRGPGRVSRSACVAAGEIGARMRFEGGGRKPRTRRTRSMGSAARSARDSHRACRSIVRGVGGASPTPDGIIEAMAKPSYRVRPETAILTRGFDPALSVGAARPPVYRSSTFVFSSPEAAERAFAIALGKLQPTEDEDVDLIYSRLSHPNAEILEDHLVPLERGAQCAAVFNSGMAAIATCCFAFLPRGSALLHT